MINWSTDEKKFKKENPKEYKIWRLTQLINYGLNKNERLDTAEVKKSWLIIKDRLDFDRRKTIEFLIWGKKWRKEAGLLPDRSNFWTWYFGHHTS